MRKKKTEPTENSTIIRFKYLTDPQARLQIAHGIFGGINTQGEIEMNFYHESDNLPQYTQQILSDDGTLGLETDPNERENEHELVRYIHSRVLLNYHTAKGLLEWLEEKISFLEEEGMRNEDFDSESGIEQ